MEVSIQYWRLRKRWKPCLTHNWAENGEKRQKVGPKNWSFWRIFGVLEFLEWFGVFLERCGEGKKFGISMSLLAHICILVHVYIGKY